jgi:anti-sigma B factor antagonist
MKIDVEDHAGIKVLRLAGDLRAEEGHSLVERANDVLEGRGAQVIIEMSGVPYVTSAGINALVRITAQANTQEQRVVLANPSPLVANVFVVTRLNRFFEIFDSLDEALAKLG